MTDANLDTSAVPSATSPGAALTAARLKQGISIDEVASRLKLSRRQIQALEADRYDELPGATFAKGFLKNYARLLSLDLEPLLQALEQRLPVAAAELKGADASPMYLPRPPRKRKIRKAGYKVIAAIALVLVGSLLFSVLQMGSKEPVVMVAPHKAEENTATVILPQASLPLVPPPIAAPVAATAEIKPPAAAPAVLLPEQKPAIADNEIHLVASGDTWVQITDAGGQRVLAEIMHAGDERRLAADKPPYRVVIGKAKDAKLLYRGQPQDLLPYTKAEVATLSLQ